jgi:putative ABC transport system permease protein
VLGANVVVSGPQSGDNAALDAGAALQIENLRLPEVVSLAPYLYVSAEAHAGANSTAVIVAGTWFDEAARMNSSWKVDGSWANGRDNRADCMIGEQAASRLGLISGQNVTIRYAKKEATLRVSGIITAGASEDSQIFIALPLAQELTGEGQRASVIQITANGSAPQIEGVIGRLSTALPGLQVRPLHQLAQAEGRLLERIRGLLFATVLLILVLTSLGVLAAMAGLALERRRDVGLMKALGGSVRRIMRIFLAEATAVGFTGGILGFIVGIALSEWIGERVFSVSITPRLIVLPATLALMVIVSLAGALPLRLLGRVRPSEILRGE